MKRRSSLKRGMVGLFLAPACALIPLLLVNFLVTFLGPPGAGGPLNLGSRELLLEIGLIFAVMTSVTLVLGGLTWTVLRLGGLESQRAYVLAGSLEGLCLAFLVNHAAEDGALVIQLVAAGLVTASGALIALTFWRIARIQ